MTVRTDQGFPRSWSLVAMFLTVLAARFLLIAVFGHPMPYADEWDAGAQGLLLPYLNGHLGLDQLLAPHNEHRLLTSRLLGLAEFEIAGGWNVRFQMLVNATIAAGLATWLTALLLDLVPPRRRLFLVAVSALAFSLPVGFEITLMGMNAHFYLLIIFSLAALLTFVRAEPLGWRWWTGLVWAALAMASMASAAVTPMVAVAVMGLQTAAGVRRFTWRNGIAAAVLVAATALMWTWVPVIPQNQGLHAQSVAQFLVALAAIAALPLVTPLGIAFVHGPLIGLVFRTLRDRIDWQERAWIAISIAAWVAAQMVSIAYNRTLQPLASRYLDMVLMLLPISAAALLNLPRPGRWLSMTGAIWVFVVMTSVSFEAGISSLRQARAQFERLQTEQHVVVQFLTDGDPAAILAKKATLSYPRPDRLTAVLSDPGIRSLLPTEVQPNSQEAFDRNRLALHGGIRPVIDSIIAAIGPIALGFASLALGCWAVAGYLSARRSDEVEPKL